MATAVVNNTDGEDRSGGDSSSTKWGKAVIAAAMVEREETTPAQQQALYTVIQEKRSCSVEPPELMVMSWKVPEDGSNP